MKRVNWVGDVRGVSFVRQRVKVNEFLYVIILRV